MAQGRASSISINIQDVWNQNIDGNGPARQGRHEKRAAARADAEKASVAGIKDDEIAEKAEEVCPTNGSAVEEAADVNSAAKAKEHNEKPIEKVEDLKDEVCPDELYGCRNESKLVSVETLECGVAPTKDTTKFYTITYEDYDDTDEED